MPKCFKKSRMENSIMSDDESIVEFVCWFCRHGSHSECMVNMPFSSGEDDCSFSIIHQRCECDKRGHK